MNKEEILKMSKKEIEEYKWDNNNCNNCDDCNNCNHCNDCDDCNHCSDCYNCRNAKNLKYAILNVELTKEEYEKKIKELKL